MDMKTFILAVLVVTVTSTEETKKDEGGQQTRYGGGGFGGGGIGSGIGGGGFQGGCPSGYVRSHGACVQSNLAGGGGFGGHSNHGNQGFGRPNAYPGQGFGNQGFGNQGFGNQGFLPGHQGGFNQGQGGFGHGHQGGFIHGQQGFRPGQGGFGHGQQGFLPGQGGFVHGQQGFGNQGIGQGFASGGHVGAVPVSEPAYDCARTASAQVYGVFTNCKFWCDPPQNYWSAVPQKICCDERNGFCPQVRAECPKFGGGAGPVCCHVDSQCPNLNDKCCHDACLGHKVCKRSQVYGK